MVGDTEIFFGLCAVVADKLFCLDSMILEELAHGIKVLHWYNVVFRVVEEHHIEVTARCPAAGERIFAEGRLESETGGYWY